MENNENWSEDKLQAECFQWFYNTYPHLRGLLYAVPNGGNRNIKEATKLKATGVVRGIPDMQAHYKGKTMFFELKTPKKGYLSKDQIKIHRKLELQGFEVHIVRALVQFKFYITQFFQLT